MHRVTLRRLQVLLSNLNQRTHSRKMSLSDIDTVTSVLQHGPNRSEINGKQLTLALAGEYIASSTAAVKPLLVWELEKSYYPRYYLPEQSLHADIRKHLKGLEPKGDGEGNRHAPLKLPVSVELVDTIEAQNKETKGLVEKVTVGPKTMTWVRFVGGKLNGLIRFERDDIGRLSVLVIFK